MTKRVLVVDDEAAVREVVVETLADFGYECVEAADGFEALRIARARVPDLIILDVLMPQMSGDEVHESLRRDPATRYLPVIFLSAQGDAQHKVRRLLNGADDYLGKPFDTEELAARVTTAIRRSAELRALNPLSGLPGNVAISEELTRRLRGPDRWACLYCDLDHFKEFNDHYGFARGDELIVLLARILGDVSDDRDLGAFIGHVGGDDFVMIVPEAAAEQTARDIVRRFDLVAPTAYDSDDRERGYIVRRDRRGVELNLSFVTVSIGIVPITRERFFDAVAVSRAAAEVKQIAKARDGSSWAVDRRQAAEGSPTLPVA
jgi:diguanylate cyclase (GGDEF)-like protein